jgi:DNA-binding MarR family transcriptional regulator
MYNIYDRSLAMKQRKTLLTLNEKSGEFDAEIIDIYTKNQNRHFRKGEFFTVHFSLEELLIDREYSALTLRILALLLTKLDYNNRIKGFRQSDLADRLKSSQANVSRALKVLEEDKIIEKDGIDYYFNSRYVKYAGDSKTTKARKAQQKNKTPQ